MMDHSKNSRLDASPIPDRGNRIGDLLPHYAYPGELKDLAKLARRFLVGYTGDKLGDAVVPWDALIPLHRDGSISTSVPAHNRVTLGMQGRFWSRVSRSTV